MLALRFFSQKPLMPERVIPLLVESVRRAEPTLCEQLCVTLGNYGGNAQVALPALRECLGSSQRQSVFIAASNAIAHIENGSSK